MQIVRRDVLVEVEKGCVIFCLEALPKMGLCRYDADCYERSAIWSWKGGSFLCLFLIFSCSIVLCYGWSQTWGNDDMMQIVMRDVPVEVEKVSAIFCHFWKLSSSCLYYGRSQLWANHDMMQIVRRDVPVEVEKVGPFASSETFPVWVKFLLMMLWCRLLWEMCLLKLKRWVRSFFTPEAFSVAVFCNRGREWKPVLQSNCFGNLFCVVTSYLFGSDFFKEVPVEIEKCNVQFLDASVHIQMFMPPLA